MQELYNTKNQNLIEIGKSFERRRCNHPPQSPLPPHECIKSIVIIDGENKHRYIVASDNEKLRWSLRKIPGIPLIYMNRSVMVMEPLSKASAQVSRRLEKGKLSAGLNDVKVGLKVPEKINNEPESDVTQKTKRKKGPKGPNPLSVKKKKTNDNGEKKNDEEDSQKKKRKRKHKKSGAVDEEGNKGAEQDIDENLQGAGNESD